MALKFPSCTRHLGPLVPGTTVENGARVFGRSYELDPVKAAWDIGAIVRWLDFNDTWLAEEWGHPSDNLGAIMALSDYISRVNIANHKSPLNIKDVLEYMVKAHEIQGVLALENSFNKVGLDHVLLVRVASTAVATHMLGGIEIKLLMLYLKPGLMAPHFEPIGMRLMQVQENHGLQVMRHRAQFAYL